MSFFPTQPLFVGIEISPSFIRVAALRRKKKGWIIEQLKEFSPPETLSSLPPEALIATAFPSREVLVRSLYIQLKQNKDIEAALAFQVEPLLPYPPDAGIVEHLIVSKGESGTLLTVLAVRKDHLQHHLDSLKPLSIDPEKVVCSPLALTSLTQVLPQNKAPFFILHIGEKEGTVAFIEKNKLLTARSLEIQEDFLFEIQKSILAISAAYKTKIANSILLFGNSALADSIQQETGKTVVLPSNSQLSISPDKLLQFGYAIGVALSAADEANTHFRKKEFSHRHPWKRHKKLLVTYFLLIGALFASFAVLENTVLSNQERNILQKKQALFAIEEKSESNRPSEIAQMEKEILSRPNTFPLLPGVPKVSDFLAWLSTHTEIDEQLIHIENIHYAMIKRPDFSKKNDRYQVRVEIELKAQNPSVAQLFYEALNKPNSFVDSKREIEWKAGRGKYQTSFYLKDKTRYL